MSDDPYFIGGVVAAAALAPVSDPGSCIQRISEPGECVRPGCDHGDIPNFGQPGTWMHTLKHPDVSAMDIKYEWWHGHLFD